MKDKVLLLLSGGLDSSVTAAYLKKKRFDILPIFFNREQKNLKNELSALKKVIEFLSLGEFITQKLDLSAVKGKLSKEIMISRGIPGRNLILLSLSTPYVDLYDIDSIALGNIISDDFPDCDLEFRKLASRIISKILEKKIKIFAPFADWERWDKSEVIKWAHKNKYYKLLKYSWSCWKGALDHCGKCEACINRKEGFKTAGIKDPTKYLS